MTADELAALHPELFHVTFAESWASIEVAGLLSPIELLRGLEPDSGDKNDFMSKRRPTSLAITHPEHGRVRLNDHAPLNLSSLAGRLDDGLTPTAWARLLNERVFFWVDEGQARKFAEAGVKRGYSRELLVFRTEGLVRANIERAEIAPFNTGSATRRPARRGLSTFASLRGLNYSEWQRRRGLKGRDKIVEVVIRGCVRNATNHLVKRERIA